VNRVVWGVFLDGVVPVANGNAVNGQEVDGPKGRLKDEPQRATFRLRTWRDPVG